MKNSKNSDYQQAMNRTFRFPITNREIYYLYFKNSNNVHIIKNTNIEEKC